MVYNYTRPRRPIAAMYNSPGPCYALPGLIGQSEHDPRSIKNRGPAYPFGVRWGKQFDQCSPGPKYAIDNKMFRDGRDGTPHYSLYAKAKDSVSFRTPGPGQYQPERAGPNARRSAPTYSFGLKLRQRGTDQGPAPNAYSVDEMLGRTVRSSKKQSPMFTMRTKTHVGAFYEDLAKSPGPSHYDVVTPDTYKNKKPQYSMIGRNVMPSDTTTKPGPGQHSPEKVYVNKRAAPAPSFGIRHSEFIAPLIVEA